MKNNCIIIIIASIILLSCNNKNEKEEITTLNSLKKEINLKENIIPLSPLRSFAFLENGKFVVVTENQKIIIYNKNGEQLKEITNIGQGELEIYNPSIVRSYKNNFYVWCQDLLKMVEFSEEGNPVNEYFGFNHAIQRFEIDDSKIYTYINSTLAKPYIQVYDKEKRSIIKEFGYTENNQIFTNLNACGGAFTIFKENLFYIPSHNIRIHILNTTSMDDGKIILLNDPDFEIPEISEDAELTINSNRTKAFDYSLKSPIITGAFTSDTNLIIIAEVGPIEHDGQNLITKNRKTLYLKYNSNFDLIKRKEVDYNLNQSCKLMSTYKNKLFQISQEEGENEMIYSLQEIEF